MQAIRWSWNKDKIVALSRRLDNFRQMLGSRVAVDSRDAVKGSIELLERMNREPETPPSSVHEIERLKESLGAILSSV